MYVLTPEQKNYKNNPVIIKKKIKKNIINTNNSFLRERADHFKETYLQKQKLVIATLQQLLSTNHME